MAASALTGFVVQVDNYSSDLKNKHSNEDRVKLSYFEAPTIPDTHIFRAFQATCERLAAHLKGEEAGSTASIGFYYHGMLYVAQIGDSSLNLMLPSATGEMTIHSLHEWHTGRIRDDEYGATHISVSRALGDKAFQTHGGRTFSQFSYYAFKIDHPETAFLFGHSDGVARHLGSLESPEKNASALTRVMNAQGYFNLASLGQYFSQRLLAVREQIKSTYASHCFDDCSLAAAQLRDGLLMMIADGHQGDTVSQRISNEFPDLLLTQLGCPSYRNTFTTDELSVLRKGYEFSEALSTESGIPKADLEPERPIDVSDPAKLVLITSHLGTEELKVEIPASTPTSVGSTAFSSNSHPGISPAHAAPAATGGGHSSVAASHLAATVFMPPHEDFNICKMLRELVARFLKGTPTFSLFNENFSADKIKHLSWEETLTQMLVFLNEKAAEVAPKPATAVGMTAEIMKEILDRPESKALSFVKELIESPSHKKDFQTTYESYTKLAALEKMGL